MPEKLTVYDHRTGDLAIEPGRAPARRLAGLMVASPATGSYLDLVEPMRASRDQADLFLRGDSHWSFAGCELAYRAICRVLDAAPVPDLAARGGPAAEVLGDLGIKLDPPRPDLTVEHWFQRDAVLAEDNSLSRAIREGTLNRPRFVGAQAVFRNDRPDADPRRVALFGDSYAHAIPTRLTGMLAETFRELHFVWSTSLDWAYLDRIRPDILLCECAERFLSRVPDDKFDLSAVRLPA